MNERIDEEIGALLDGRVPEPRRSELLTLLAADDADYEVFADTAAVLREAEEEGTAEKESVDHSEVVREIPVVGETPVVGVTPAVGETPVVGETPGVGETPVVRETPVIPLRPRRALGWRSPAVRALAAAAVLATVVLVPVIRSRMNEGGWQNPRRMAALVLPPGAQPPGEWDHAWTTRGVGGTVPNLAVAGRVGALHLDMEVAARASDPVDSATVVPLALNAAVTLEGAEELGPGQAAPKYHDIAELTDWSRSQVLERLADARAEVVQYVDPDYFATSAWTEAARLAAKRKDAAFFHAEDSRKALERAITLEGLSPEAVAAANHVRGFKDPENAQEWEDLEGALDDLQRGLTR